MALDLEVPVEPQTEVVAPARTQWWRRWWANPRVALVAVAAAFFLALGMCLHQLSLPGVLHGIDEYDDGFYLGTVMRFVNGTLPYKDFVYPQPPGLFLLLSPLGLLGRIVGTRTLMADVRILTAFVTAGNAALVAFLLRRRGIVPALVGGVMLALYPWAVTADKTLMLEPYLVLACLLALCFMFSGDEPAGRRRLLLGGLVFGFACTLKLWAVLPAGVAIVCCLPKWRTQVRPLLTGIIAGSVIPSLPFVLLAPHAFFHDLIGIQFLRHAAPQKELAGDRLVDVTGITALPGIHPSYRLAYTIAALLAGVVVIAFLAPVRRTVFDWYALGAGGLSVAAMFISPDFHLHYTYFPAAFVALLLGVSCDRIARGAGAIVSRWLRPPALVAGIAAVVAIGLIAAVGHRGIAEETRFVREEPGYLTLGEKSLAIAEVVPAGACTITDEPGLTVLANRFVPNRSSCPDVVDTFSTWISYDPDSLPPSAGPFNASLVAAWQSWLGAADYAVFTGSPFRIPWSPELTAWFNQNYRLIAQPYGDLIYQFVGHRAS